MSGVWDGGKGSEHKRVSSWDAYRSCSIWVKKLPLEWLNLIHGDSVEFEDESLWNHDKVMTKYAFEQQLEKTGFRQK